MNWLPASSVISVGWNFLLKVKENLLAIGRAVNGKTLVHLCKFQQIHLQRIEQLKKIILDGSPCCGIRYRGDH
jgi:hypothetical protein